MFIGTTVIAEFMYSLVLINFLVSVLDGSLTGEVGCPRSSMLKSPFNLRGK